MNVWFRNLSLGFVALFATLFTLAACQQSTPSKAPNPINNPVSKEVENRVQKIEAMSDEGSKWKAVNELTVWLSKGAYDLLEKGDSEKNLSYKLLISAYQTSVKKLVDETEVHLVSNRSKVKDALLAEWKNDKAIDGRWPHHAQVAGRILASISNDQSMLIK